MTKDFRQREPAVIDPLQPFLRQQGVLFLDGGLATELEARGYDLRDALWSARLLRDAPGAIRQVHLDYLRAGADCIIAASYQATIPGFVAQGMSADAAADLLRRSVELARAARAAFWADPARDESRLRPLVAASVGPYGAYLADGSEYTGNYGLTQAALEAFHEERWRILAGSGPDLMACETIPSAPEARALRNVLTLTPHMPVWFSFSCRDGSHLNDGSTLAASVAALEDVEQVVAVGVNCTAPRHIPELVKAARSVTSKPILVYPNSGEAYDAAEKRWFGLSMPVSFAQESSAWHAAGATLLGGCCRTGPDHIRAIREVISKETSS